MAAAARPDQLSSNQNTIKKERSILVKLFRLEFTKEDLKKISNFEEYLKKISETFINIVIEDVNKEEDSIKLLRGDVEPIKEILEDIKSVTYPAKILFMKFPNQENLTFEKRDTPEFQGEEKKQKTIIETDFEHIIGLTSDEREREQCNILDYNYFGAIANLYEFYLPNYYNNLIIPTLEELNKHFSIISENKRSIKSLQEKQSKDELSNPDLETLNTNITKLFKCAYILASFYMIFERVKNRFNAIDTFIKKKCEIPIITIRNENTKTMKTITNLKAKTNPSQTINATKREEVHSRKKFINLLMTKNQTEFFETPKEKQFISNIKYCLQYIYLGTDLLGEKINKNELSKKFIEAINEFFQEKEAELLRKEELKKQRAEEKRLALEQHKREMENQRRKNTPSARLPNANNRKNKKTNKTKKNTGAGAGANASTVVGASASASFSVSASANANAHQSANAMQLADENPDSWRRRLGLPHLGKGILNILGLRTKSDGSLEPDSDSVSMSSKKSETSRKSRWSLLSKKSSKNSNKK